MGSPLPKCALLLQAQMGSRRLSSLSHCTLSSPSLEGNAAALHTNKVQAMPFTFKTGAPQCLPEPPACNFLECERPSGACFLCFINK